MLAQLMERYSPAISLLESVQGCSTKPTIFSPLLYVNFDRVMASPSPTKCMARPSQTTVRSGATSLGRHNPRALARAANAAVSFAILTCLPSCPTRATRKHLITCVGIPSRMRACCATTAWKLKIHWPIQICHREIFCLSFDIFIYVRASNILVMQLLARPRVRLTNTLQ